MGRAKISIRMDAREKGDGESVTFPHGLGESGRRTRLYGSS